MSGIASLFSMGDHGPYIWTAYGVVAFLLLAMFVWTWQSVRRAERLESSLSQQRVRRRRNRQPGGEDAPS